MKQIFSLKKVLKKPPFIYKTSFFCRLSNVSSKHLSWIRKNHLDPPGSGSATQILQKRGEQRLAGTLKSWTLTVKPWRSNPAKYWNNEIKRVILNRERIYLDQCCGSKYTEYGSGSRILANLDPDLWIVNWCPNFYTFCHFILFLLAGCVDPHPYSTSLLNTDPMRLRIHITDFDYTYNFSFPME